jgi:hypothetical protein
MKTIAELIAVLQELPQDMIVVLAADEEGNDFNPWYDTGYGIWDEDDQEFSTSVYDESDDDYDIERAVTLDESNAICLWP